MIRVQLGDERGLQMALRKAEAEVRAAEDKRGEEVLELAIETCRKWERYKQMENEIRQAYQERFGHDQG
ncbi:MAG: hypothetical protein J3T61_01405 [Candidatus Brocadiales bacterium]|nr:hypothetical protein [Candidatus Bathyanammoxibius sp.]